MHLCKLLTNVFAMYPAPGRWRLLSRLLGFWSGFASATQFFEGSFRKLCENLKLAAQVVLAGACHSPKPPE
jgi:hypothetical protein